MPVVPSFRGFAPAPNLAQSYIAGIGANQRDRSIAQEGQIARAKIRSDEFQQQQQLQFQREKLAQDAVQAQMEFQAKTAQQERDEMRKQQELEMEKAYKESTIGLRQQQLAQAEEAMRMKDQMAQQQLQSMDAFRKGSLGMRGQELESIENYRQGSMYMRGDELEARNRGLDIQQEGLGLRKQGLGLQERGVAANEGRLKLSTQEASAKMLADQEYKKMFEANVAKGMQPDEASREAMLAINPSRFGGAGSAAVRPPPGAIDTEVTKTAEVEARPARPEMKTGGFFGLGATTIPARPAVPGVPGKTTTHRVPAPRPAGPMQIPAVPPGVTNRTEAGTGPQMSTVVDKSRIESGRTDIPQAAIKYLREHPDTWKKFDAKYGNEDDPHPSDNFLDDME